MKALIVALIYLCLLGLLLHHSSRISKLEQEQKRLAKIAHLTQIVNDTNQILNLYIGNARIGTISNNLFSPTKP